MSGDQTHRFSQPPSKVLHVRNLPYETTHEELCELAAPFGKLVQSKLNVGPNRNQAFIEFPDQPSAVAMCNYFNGSADPAKVRGKTVYLQYSNRQEIINAKNTADTPSNVLLVSLENLMPEVPITLEVLHLVFSAFGFVHKIATFEKQAGLQALVQFDDPATAEQVKTALDGRHIPKHLLSNTPYPPLLKITFSQHQDLNVRVQSHRSRDYTAAGGYLPTTSNPNDPILTLQAPINIGDPSESNVLLAQVDNMAYPVTVDALHTVFSPYGFVQKIAIFEKGGQHQALIQYPDGMSATNAMNALEGHAIYDGGYNKLKITYSRHKDLNVKGNNERSFDYTQASTAQPGSAHPSYGAANRGNPAPIASYNGPNADLLAGGGGAPLGPHEMPPTGMDYEAAHAAVAKGAEAVMKSPQPASSGPQYGAPASGPPQQYGALQQNQPPPMYQGGAPPAYGGGGPQGAPPAMYGAPQGGPPAHYGAPASQPHYGAPQQPQYGAPQQPPAGSQPPPGYGQPQQAAYHGQPPAYQQQGAPQYQPSNGGEPPGQHGYQQPPPGQQYGGPQQRPQY